MGDDDPVLTFCCRPNNPTGALEPLPADRPLAVDEAYFEYCGETAIPLLDDGVIVLRTFSKAFALAGATFPSKRTTSSGWIPASFAMSAVDGAQPYSLKSRESVLTSGPPGNAKHFLE